MDHAFIDQHDIAGRYLRKELPEAERDAFQAHLVDCQECVDRVLLAEMFQKEMPPPLAAPPPEPSTPEFVLTGLLSPPAAAAGARHRLPFAVANRLPADPGSGADPGRAGSLVLVGAEPR